MTNYERTRKTIEGTARDTINSNCQNIGYYFCSNGTSYYWHEDALKNEILWLESESE